MSAIEYVESDNSLEINVRFLMTIEKTVKLKKIMLGFLVLIYLMISLITWEPNNKNSFPRSIFISTYKQLFFVLASIPIGILLYFLILKLLIITNKKSAENRPNIFKGHLDNYSSILILPFLFSSPLFELLNNFINFPIFYSKFITSIYFVFLITFEYSLHKADVNAHMKTTIHNNEDESIVEYFDFVPLIGKTLGNSRKINKNNSGNYQIGISYLTGKRKFGINIPVINRHLSKIEFENFYELNFGKFDVCTFSIVIMDGDIIEDDLKPNDPRYKGKIFGPMVGTSDNYKEAKHIIKTLEKYIPIEIIRPIKYSQKFIGLNQGFQEEKNRIN